MASGPGREAGRHVLSCGRRALLVPCADLAEVMALHARLRSAPLPGQIEAIAAARTVLVSFESPADAREARDRLTASGGMVPGAVDIGAVDPGAIGAVAATDPGGPITLDVVYDGEDLETTAAGLGMSASRLVDLHTSTAWVAAFGGFAPGFAYCAPAGQAPWSSVSRRPSPRTAVPPGAVALAGEFSAVYPRASPGGWQLIGRTPAVLWDTEREGSPALIGPGDQVAYRAVRAGIRTRHRRPRSVRAAARDGARTHAPAEARTADPGSGSVTALVVDQPGPRLLIQDRGRPGHGDLGVTASGWADAPAALEAALAVGNPPDAPGLEILGGMARLCAQRDLVMAAVGAAAPLRILGSDGARSVPLASPFALSAGEVLEVGAVTHGLRLSLAVRGGILAPRELGSCASDTLSGLGPAPLVAGQRLAVGDAQGLSAVGPVGPVGPVTAPVGTGPQARGEATANPAQALVLRMLPGPRADWFDADALAALAGGAWTISAQADRVGVRLDPDPRAHPLARRAEHRAAELPSEGMVAGSIQVPPSGLPVIMGVDHPVTGGYPVIAVLEEESLPALAQLPPGAGVRLAWA